MKWLSVNSALLFIALVAAHFDAATQNSSQAGDPKDKPKLDGKWVVIRQEERGNLVPTAISKRLSMVIEGNKMHWYIGNPAPNFSADITIDEAKKTIDAKITRSSFIGKTMLGIYKLDKDTLEMCWGEIGSDRRPDKFTSVKPGSGGPFNYTTYAREGSKAATQPAAKDKPAKDKTLAGKKDIRKLQVKRPEGWKDDGTIFDERRFIKDRMILFAAIHKGPAATKGEELAEMAKKNENLLPGRTWVKTTGIGKLADGVFIVGVGKAMGFEHDAIGAVRTIDGVTVLFLGTPADDAAARKSFLDLIRSAQFVEK